MATKSRYRPPAETRTGNPNRKGIYYSMHDRLYQEARVLELWCARTPWTQIAAELGISLSTVKRRLDDAKSQMLPHADYEQYRTEQNARLGVAIGKVMGAINDWHPTRQQIVGRGQFALEISVPNHEELIGLVGALTKLEDRFAKLHGLDTAPRAGDELEDMNDKAVAELFSAFFSDMLPTEVLAGMAADLSEDEEIQLALAEMADADLEVIDTDDGEL